MVSNDDKALVRVSPTPGQGSRTLAASWRGIWEHIPVFVPQRPNDMFVEFSLTAYNIWWIIVVSTTYFTILFVPFDIAFSTSDVCTFNADGYDIINLLLSIVFFVDVLVNFNTAYWNGKANEWVLWRPSIAVHYVLTSGMFWVDILAAFPFPWVVGAALDCERQTSVRLLNLITLTRLVRLLRVYRVWRLIKGVERASVMSLAIFTIFRNGQFVLCLVHVAACMFYFLTDILYYSTDDAATEDAAGAPDGVDSWFKLTLTELNELEVWERYVRSLYWSMTTFTTVGYGDISAVTPAEQIFIICYQFMNLGVMAYIIGTITLVVTKGDEALSARRAHLQALNDFIAAHKLRQIVEGEDEGGKDRGLHRDGSSGHPGGSSPWQHRHHHHLFHRRDHTLLEDMRSHMELYVDYESIRDEEVLGKFPRAVRRRVLSTLYAGAVSSCYLFRAQIIGQRPNFLLTLLDLGEVEVYMPGVDVLERGSKVADLQIILRGSMRVLTPELEGDPVHRHRRPSRMSIMSRIKRASKVSSLSSTLSEGSVRGGGPAVPAAAAAALACAQIRRSERELEQEEAEMKRSFEVMPDEDSDGIDEVVLWPGAALGEVAFFTDGEQAVTVVTRELSHVLALSKEDMRTLEARFPICYHAILGTLQGQARLATHILGELVERRRASVGGGAIRRTASVPVVTPAAMQDPPVARGGADGASPGREGSDVPMDCVAGTAAPTPFDPESVSSTPGPSGGPSDASGRRGAAGAYAGLAPALSDLRSPAGALVGVGARQAAPLARGASTPAPSPVASGAVAPPRGALDAVPEAPSARSEDSGAGAPPLWPQQPPALGAKVPVSPPPVAAVVPLSAPAQSAEATVDGLLSDLEAAFGTAPHELRRAANYHDVLSITLVVQQLPAVALSLATSSSGELSSAIGTSIAGGMHHSVSTPALHRAATPLGPLALSNAGVKPGAWVAAGHRAVRHANPLYASPQQLRVGLDALRVGMRGVLSALAKVLDPNARDSAGRTALMRACAEGNLTAVKKLLEHPEVDVAAKDEAGRNAVMIAAAVGGVSALEALLAAAKPPAKDIGLRSVDSAGLTAQMIACRSGHIGAVTALAQAGAPLVAVGSLQQRNADTATALIAAVRQKDTALLALLLVAAGGANFADADGRTPLHVAACELDRHMVQRLLTSGADVSARDRWGNTPLSEAEAATADEAVLTILRTAKRAIKDTKGTASMRATGLAWREQAASKRGGAPLAHGFTRKSASSHELAVFGEEGVAQGIAIEDGLVSQEESESFATDQGAGAAFGSLQYPPEGVSGAPSAAVEADSKLAPEPASGTEDGWPTYGREFRTSQSEQAFDEQS